MIYCFLIFISKIFLHDIDYSPFCQSHTKSLVINCLSFIHHFIIFFTFLSPFSSSQLHPPQNVSVSSAVKVKRNSSPPPPPVPPSYSLEDLGSGLPPLTPSLASQTQTTEYSNILFIILLTIHIIIISIVFFSDTPTSDCSTTPIPVTLRAPNAHIIHTHNTHTTHTSRFMLQVWATKYY